MGVVPLSFSSLLSSVSVMLRGAAGNFVSETATMQAEHDEIYNLLVEGACCGKVRKKEALNRLLGNSISVFQML